MFFATNLVKQLEETRPLELVIARCLQSESSYFSLKLEPRKDPLQSCSHTPGLDTVKFGYY